MKDLLLYGFASDNGNVVKASDSYVLSCEKDREQNGLCEFRTDSGFCAEEYFVMEYKAMGIKRRPIRLAPFAELVTDSGNIPLICYDDLAFDGKKHSVIVKTESVQASGIYFTFGADRRSKAGLTVFRMYTCKREELPMCCEELAAAKKEDFLPLDISDMFNAEFSAPDEAVMIDGGSFFKSESISCLLYTSPSPRD